MIGKYFSILLIASAVFSCNKDMASKNEKYVASASKVIGLTGINWNDAEPQLKNKVGYRYEAAPPNVSAFHKAEVHLPAIDDSSKIEDGQIYLHIANNNTIDVASYYTKPISQSSAFAMMLNYNNEALKTPTGITSLQGNYIENGIGGSASVNSILSKVRNGQASDQLWITYGLNGRGITIQLSLRKVNDGFYEFTYASSL